MTPQNGHNNFPVIDPQNMDSANYPTNNSK